jgi:hypothetical protein
MTKHREAVYRAAMARFREWSENYNISLASALTYKKCGGRAQNLLVRACARAERAEREK